MNIVNLIWSDRNVPERLPSVAVKSSNHWWPMNYGAVITQRVLRDTAGRNVSKGWNPFAAQGDAFRGQEIHAPLRFRTHMRDRHASVRAWRYSYLNRNWGEHRDTRVYIDTLIITEIFSLDCRLIKLRYLLGVLRNPYRKKNRNPVRVLRKTSISLIILCFESF